MSRTMLRPLLIAAVFAATPGVATAQLDALYEFDGGGDGSSWDDAANWEQVLDALGNPVAGDPAAPPNAVTSVDIPIPGALIDGSMPGQVALDVAIGTAAGGGSLAVTGGDLDARDVEVGTAGGTGTLDVTGGEMNAGDDVTVGNAAPGQVSIGGGLLSTGDDLFINAGGTVNVTAGRIEVGDRLVFSGDGQLIVGGGEVLIGDDLFGFEDAAIHLTAGLLQATDQLRLDDDLPGAPTIVIDGGIVRGQEFGDGTDPLGIVEINGTGVLQIELLSVVDALNLILAGDHFVSSDGPLTAFSVLVDLPGRPNVQFTQIAVDGVNAVPEPASPLLFLIGLLVVAIGGRQRAHRLPSPG